MRGVSDPPSDHCPLSLQGKEEFDQGSKTTAHFIRPMHARDRGLREMEFGELPASGVGRLS